MGGGGGGGGNKNHAGFTHPLCRKKPLILIFTGGMVLMPSLNFSYGALFVCRFILNKRRASLCLM